MPRNLTLGTSTLRNRNRVTNKTRLRIIAGNIDADPLVLDEDEEKARVVSTAGVDAEDANEHHLQAVLSAASQRHQTHVQRTTRGASTSSQPNVPAAYIPTPDSTGIVDNYEDLYPPERWTDPATYIRSSETIEAFFQDALNGQWTYYMDERDKDWLDKNNEEARGEGTSAQGAVSASGTTTRLASSSRSAKARGKEPEVTQPPVVSEDQFELVMGLFEKVTHEKTEYLHTAVEEGQPFPPFSDYHDVFASPLDPALFTSFTVPAWHPSPSDLVRMARAIYPWWKERRTERGGYRIIPTLNYNEADVANESYICFRHREIKAVRKTRAQQATPSDKVIRLRAEMTSSIELALMILKREQLKQVAPQLTRSVWQKRLPLLDLKRQYASIGSREDEELLLDKEKPPKKPKNETKHLLKFARRDGSEAAVLSTLNAEIIRPRERTARISSQIEQFLQAQKERDHHWEDQIDNMYQPLPVLYQSRLFKFIPPSEAPSWPTPPPDHAEGEDPPHRSPRAVRLRTARGGRLMIDRRGPMLRLRKMFGQHRSPSPMESSGDEQQWRLSDRWKFDDDDYPAVGPEGPEEQDRVLVDDFEPKYMRHAMSLLSDHDSAVLSTDPTLVFQAPDGHQQKAMPFRLGVPPPIRGMPARPPPPGYVPPIATSTQQAAAAASLQSLGSTPTPISVSTPLKKMQTPVVHPSLRISSNGGMRPPVAPAPHVLSSQATVVAPLVNGVNATHGVNGANGVNGVVNHTPTDADVPIVNHAPSILNGTGPSPSHAETNNADANGSSPSRPKPEMPHHLMSSYLPSLNGFPNIANASPYPHLSNTLSPAQKAQLKTALVGVDVASGGRLPYMGHVAPNGAAYNMQQAVPSAMNMKFAGARPMQWPGSPSQQRPIPGTGLDSRGLGGSVSPSPIGQAVPVRTPSANGLRPGMRPGGVGHAIGPNGQLAPHAMSPHLRHSPLQLPQNMPQVPTHPSPPRPPQTPMLMASPSLPHHQSVGTQGGY